MRLNIFAGTTVVSRPLGSPSGPHRGTEPHIISHLNTRDNELSRTWSNALTGARKMIALLEKMLDKVENFS